MKYIGIDLGTTNSAIAWGWIDANTNEFRQSIIDIDRVVNKDGSFKRDKLLPSCVYFPQHSLSPIIGDYAKVMLEKEPWLVAKSMKLCMDRGYHKFTSADSVSWTPIEISYRILELLKQGALYTLAKYGGFSDSNVKITVPASFEMSMRAATIDSAKKAFFPSITDKNLVPEPHAALHYFCYKNKNQPFPIEFNKKKRVLVFDLGGGTLDVSLHEVEENAAGKSSPYTIKDIAISPYTRFGGDDFDKRVAEELLRCYFKCPSGSSALYMNVLKSQFQKYAEDAKIELSKKLVHSSNRNPYGEIRKYPTLPDGWGRAFSYNLYWDEYREIIEPFLASDLKLESDYDPTRDNNIIDPILKVLDDGKKKLGFDKRPKVDVVLLNGGMTNLPVIRQRLEDLFETGIVRYVENPDEAVALGAVLYQAP